jgi:hypothetical protein
MHRHQGSTRLYAQIKMNDGKYLSRPLDTHDPSIARARILPIIDQLIAAGKLDPEARICRIYARGKCPTCGRPGLFRGGRK